MSGILQKLGEAIEKLREVVERLKAAVGGNDAVGGGMAVQDSAEAQAASGYGSQPASMGAMTIGMQPASVTGSTAPAGAQGQITMMPQAPMINNAAGAGATAAPATGDPVFERVRGLLAGSELGTDLLNRLASAGADVDVMDTAQFRAQFPGAGAVFNRNTDTIVIPESAMDDPETLALLLSHEGFHFLQEQVGVAGVSQLGGPVGDAIRGAGAAVTPQNTAEEDIHAEAQAYLVEALIARDLGATDPGFGTDQNGQVRTYGGIVDAVQSSSFYA